MAERWLEKDAFRHLVGILQLRALVGAPAAINSSRYRSSQWFADVHIGCSCAIDPGNHGIDYLGLDTGDIIERVESEGGLV